MAKRKPKALRIHDTELFHEVLLASCGERSADIHVQISAENKEFLKSIDDNHSVGMGVFIDKFLTVLRNGS